jgi:hypothetical protein
VNIEILNLTNPKSARVDGAGGGIPTLTTEDVNGACAGCDDLGLGVLLAKVCQGRQQKSRAFYQLYLEVIDLAIHRHWKIREKGQEKLRSLTQLIIFELIDQPICPKCNGTRYTKTLKPCKACDSTGLYQIKDSMRAKALGIDQSNWQRVWQYRYSDVLALISAKETQALRNIKKNLK